MSLIYLKFFFRNWIQGPQHVSGVVWSESDTLQFRNSQVSVVPATGLHINIITICSLLGKKPAKIITIIQDSIIINCVCVYLISTSKSDMTFVNKTQDFI